MASMTRSQRGELRQVAVVIRSVDVSEAVRGRERRRLEFRKARERLVDDSVRFALLGREVEQDDGHARVGEMGGDLRAHDAGAEDGRFTHEKRGGRHEQVPEGSNKATGAARKPNGLF